MKKILAASATFAHPDDEAFRSSGTLALLAQHGVRVELLGSFSEDLWVKYYELFILVSPPKPVGLQLPLVLVTSEMTTTCGKNSIPVVRSKIDVLLEEELG